MGRSGYPGMASWAQVSSSGLPGLPTGPVTCELLAAGRGRVHRVAVFGSVARGEARPDSDLDLLVDFEPGASLLDHVGLFQDLEELLGVGVGVVSRSALKPRDDHIRAEAVDR